MKRLKWKKRAIIVNYSTGFGFKQGSYSTFRKFVKFSRGTDLTCTGSMLVMCGI